MKIHISTNDGVPIYRQIINQVTYLVAANRLRPGDELPPIRTLAEQLLVNPNTVARAYRDLESAGVVESRQGSGTRVANNHSPLTKDAKRRILAERADALLTQARQLGIDFDDVVKLLHERESKLGAKP